MRRKLIHAVNVDRTVFVQRIGPPLEALLCLACTVAGAVMEHLVLVCHPPTLGGSLLLRRALAFRRLRSRSGAGGPFRRLRWCLFNGVGACGRIFFAGVGLIAVFLPAGSRPEAICSAVAARLGVFAVSAGGGLAAGTRPEVICSASAALKDFKFSSSTDVPAGASPFFAGAWPEDADSCVVGSFPSSVGIGIFISPRISFISSRPKVFSARRASGSPSMERITLRKLS